MMPPKRDHSSEGAGIDSWLMSYADMITLLMCFFIIFVSVSEPKNDKFSAVTQGLASQFGSVNLSTPFEGAMQSLEGIVEAHKAFKDVAIVKTDHSIEAELASGRFFKPDTADFDETQIQMLSEMVDGLKKASFLDYHITVEGYTSDAVPKSAIYTSNWELSSVRAARLVRFFVEHGIPEDNMRAIGYGDTKPKVSNKDNQGKPIEANQEKNDRMVIKLERAM